MVARTVAHRRSLFIYCHRTLGNLIFNSSSTHQLLSMLLLFLFRLYVLKCMNFLIIFIVYTSHTHILGVYHMRKNAWGFTMNFYDNSVCSNFDEWTMFFETGNEEGLQFGYNYIVKRIFCFSLLIRQSFFVEFPATTITNQLHLNSKGLKVFEDWFSRKRKLHQVIKKKTAWRI